MRCYFPDVLLAMEISGPENASAGTNSPDVGANGAADAPKTNSLNHNDIKRKVSSQYFRAIF